MYNFYRNVVIIGLGIFLFSCSPVYYSEPQTYGGTLQTKVSSDIWGEWSNNDVVWVIDEKGMTVNNSKIDTVTNITDITVDFFGLTDTSVLYQKGKFYLYNCRENDTPWELNILEKKWNGDIKIYDCREAELIIKDKNLTLKEARFNLDDVDTLVQTLNPDFEYNMNFMHATFDGQISRKTFRKMTKNKFLFTTLKKDGTAYAILSKTRSED